MSLFGELKRRNVLRVAVAYLAVSWFVVQVVETLFPIFGLTDTQFRLIVIVLAIGFPLALILSWIYEITPEGLKLEKDVDRSVSATHRTGKKFDRAIIVVLAMSLGYFAFDKFVLDPARDAELVEEATEKGRSKAIVESYGENSIAVLPFVNMSDDLSNEYFSDGISEELLNLLAQIPELRVISRSSAFSLKGKDISIPAIGRQLNVAHVLEGSVRKSGDRIRITAQLIDAGSDTHLWSETYDRTLDDIFAIQDDIAADVVKQLKVMLLGDVPHVRPTNPEAFAIYLHARHLSRQVTKDGLERAAQRYQQAIEIDPDFVVARTGLALVYINQAKEDLLPWDKGHALALEATETALAIEPDFAQAYVSLGLIAMDDGDLAAAARHYKRALNLDPTDIGIICSSAGVAANLGRTDLAVLLDEYCVARDPLNPRAHNNLGASYSATRQFEEAVASYRTALTLSPGYLGAQATLGTALLLMGDGERALEAIKQESVEGFRMLGLIMAYHALGQSSASDEALADMIEKHGRDWAYNIAYALAYRGETDRAFDWLDKAAEYNDPGLVEIATQPLFIELHADPRWSPFLRKIGKSPEILGAIEFDVTPPQY